MILQRLADTLMTISAFLIIASLLISHEWVGRRTILAALVLTFVSSVAGRRARSHAAVEPRSGYPRTDSR